MLPLTLPAAVGLNVTVAVTLCPELRVFGVVIPLIPNSDPVSVRTDIVKFEPPVFDKDRLAFPVDPTVTVPKFNEVLLTVNCGWALMIVPLKFTTTGEEPESPCIVSVPLALPVFVPLSETV